MEAGLAALRIQAREAIAAATGPEAVEEARIRFLGRKGLLTAALRELGKAPAAERPRLGQLANTIKAELEGLLAERLTMASTAPAPVSTGPLLDRSLPGRGMPLGRRHPVSQVLEEVCSIFTDLGFSVAEGPDVELDFYNFEALNIPPHHPARDMHDTFYLGEGVLLRTHTSPMQIRAMQARRPPLRMIAPGKVYRCDSDITHTPMFHQVEGFLVDRRVSFGDLKGLLSLFCQRMFAPDIALRFRPSFFPFTEPSVEVDIACVICGGKGCRVCKTTGWLEILGAGLIDPEVFRMVGYDPEEVSGLAFGLGIERIAMLRYGIDDIRLFYENDLRFLTQF
ncbi:MAG: phenylalanine--tRNA ligase subunit alpha [Thermodesulfobacteriota bacterium]